MRTTSGPPQVTVYEIRPGEHLMAWRIVRSEHEDDPVFLNSLRSNYELTREPRHVERRSTVMHMGISVYLDEQVARETAQKWDKLGDWIAQLRMEHGHGFNYAHTGHRLH